MNKVRRNALGEIIDDMQALVERRDELAASLDVVREALEQERDDEQESFDNMPEALQGAEKGEEMASGIESLTQALDQLQELIDALRNFDFDAAASLIDEARGIA
jgi:hypothetical protein